MLTTKIVRRVRGSMIFVILVLWIVVRGQADDGVIKEKKIDVDPYRIIGISARQYSTGRQVFDYRKNGIRVDVRVVPLSKNDTTKDDNFPEFPTTDIGRCIIDLSLVCAKKRFSQFLNSIGDLNEIYLMGQQIKLVKTRAISDRKSTNDSNDNIQRSVNDFFDTFALRITLPRWNGKREKNQIDVMLDETAISEGRGKGGGGGGKGKGGKCKMMMMAGLMMLKMKLMGMATMKGMMMAGMSLMVSIGMLMQKYIKGGGGGGQGGGGGGQYKEIVLLTKASGGGGGGGGGGAGCCSSPDTYYSAPPSSSYGHPSGGGGGGWGRSLERKFIATDHDRTNYTTDSINSPIKNDRSDMNQSYRYPPVDTNFTYSSWNATNHGEPPKYRYANDKSTSHAENNGDAEPLLRSESNNYAIDEDPEGSRDYAVDSRPASYVDNVNHVASTNYVADNYDTSSARTVYSDEWQPIEGKFQPSNPMRDIRESGSSNSGNSNLRGI